MSPPRSDGNGPVDETRPVHSPGIGGLAVIPTRLPRGDGATWASDPRPSPTLHRVEPTIGTAPLRRKAQENTRVVADSVYARLRAAILSAELRPNRRLVEDDLADWLRVSRTPVREALLRLEQEGLVERDRGWIVRERNPTETRALVECRLAIEGYAARLAAARISQASLAELTTLADAMEESGLSRLEFNRLNEEFHRLITLAADNPMLANLHAQTKMNYWNLSVPVVFTPDVDRQVHEHHRSLLVALAAGDGSTAEQIARRHVQLTMDIVLEAVGLQVERPAPPG